MFLKNFCLATCAMSCAMSGVMALTYGMLALEVGAASPQPLAPLLPADVQVQGLVLDRTITAAGREFYRRFAARWLEQDSAGHYVISVHEQPYSRRGTMVWVEFWQERIFQAALPPDRAKAAALAQEAGTASYRNVVDAETRLLLFREPDLAGSEF